MIKDQKSFVLYDSYADQIETLSDAQAGVLFKSILAYRTSGKRPYISDPMIRMAFCFIASQLDRDAEKWEDVRQKRREAGRLGGAPEGNQNASKNKQNKQKQAKQTKQAVNVNDNVNADVNADVDANVSVDVNKEKEDFSHVSLTDEERADLVSQSDSLTIERYIQNISDWQVKKRRITKKAYILIKSWLEEDRAKRKPAIRSNDDEPSYDID